MSKPRKFPCPYCKGKGSWIEVVLDWGQGPLYECGVCDGEGMLEIDGPRHQQLKQWKADALLMPGVVKDEPND